MKNRPAGGNHLSRRTRCSRPAGIAGRRTRRTDLAFSATGTSHAAQTGPGDRRTWLASIGSAPARRGRGRALALATGVCHTPVDAGDIVKVESVDSETTAATNTRASVVSSPPRCAARLPADWLVLCGRPRGRSRSNMSQDTMAGKRDYYQVLETNRSASGDDIRRSYRRLARQYHPDLNPSAEAEERFKEINEAYEVLSDDSRRAAYDRFGHAGSGMPGGFGGATPSASVVGRFSVRRHFRDFFGAPGTAAAAAHALARCRYPGRPDDRVRGSDLRRGRRTSRSPVSRSARVAMGVRMRDGQKPPICSVCHGAGQVRRAQQTILGQFMTSTPCSACGGERCQHHRSLPRLPGAWTRCQDADDYSLYSSRNRRQLLASPDRAGRGKSGRRARRPCLRAHYRRASPALHPQ